MRTIDLLSRAVLLIAPIALLAAVPGCGVVSSGDSDSRREQAMNAGVQHMFDEIYASRRPSGFEEIDVSSELAVQFPPGMGRADVEKVFQAVSSSRTVESTPQLLVIRDIRGKPMLEPDARTILMTFSFDPSGKLVSTKALHMKRQ